MKKVTEVTKDGYAAITKEGDTIVSSRTQRVDGYYAQNRLVRDNIQKEAVTRRWAIPIAQVPFADYQELAKRNPELKSKDPEVLTKAWLKTLRDLRNVNLRTVRGSLIPDSMNPDRGSIVLPSRVQKELVKENAS